METEAALVEGYHRGAKPFAKPLFFGKRPFLSRIRLSEDALTLIAAMNRLLFTVIVSWQTRNRRRAGRAEKWCKDYGLIQLHKGLYSGKLYLTERKQLDHKMLNLLNGRHDRYCSFVMCSSCAPNTIASFEIHNPPWVDSHYEIVQN